MADEMHDVVKLLLKRMESHPEEFARGMSRWGWLVNDAMEHGSDEERAALKEGLRPILMQEIHENVMDELLNGEERRHREAEEAEYEKQLIQQHSKNMAVQLGQQQAQQVTGSFGKPLVSARHPTSSDMEANGIMNALRNIIK